MAAERGMSTLAVALDEFQQALHFFLCADADTHEAGTDVLRTIAKKDALRVQLLAQFRTPGAEIGQNEISGAGKSLYVELMQLFFKPGAGAQYVFHVGLHGAGVADGRFRGGQRGYVDGEGSRGTAKDRERFRAGDDGAEAKSRESRGFRKCTRYEKLRVLADQRHYGDAGEFGVGFVDDDGCVSGCFQNG